MANPNYLETTILGADRVELVRILYRGAIGSIQDARRCLANGDAMKRSKSVSKALDFISELVLSLNFEAGGSIARQLGDLYAYVQNLLIQAHAQRSDAKLAEALSLMETLLSGWNEQKPLPEPSPEQVEVAEGKVEADPIAANREMMTNPYETTAEPVKRSWSL